MPRPLDDLGPDFDRRWKQAPRTRRRELIAELRDLYFMLEDNDVPLLARLPGQKLQRFLSPADDLSLESTAVRPAVPAAAAQGHLFTDPDADPVPAPTAPKKENPFLPRSVLARLQESQNQASAGLRDLMQRGQDQAVSHLGQAAARLADIAISRPPTHEQVDLERELRLRLGPLVETLIEAHTEVIKSELRVRLRAEMDRLIAEHVRK